MENEPVSYYGTRTDRDSYGHIPVRPYAALRSTWTDPKPAEGLHYSSWYWHTAFDNEHNDAFVDAWRTTYYLPEWHAISDFRRREAGVGLGSTETYTLDRSTATSLLEGSGLPPGV